MYPIINLRTHKMDLHWYLRTLEEVVIRVLSSTFSIQASTVEGLTGVWVGKPLNPIYITLVVSYFFLCTTCYASELSWLFITH